MSILISFGIIAGLAVVLRWTYGTGQSHQRRYPPSSARTPRQPTRFEYLTDANTAESLPDGGHDVLDPAPADSVVDAAEPPDEGYGLLRTVLVADSARQAALIQELLLDGGVRSTTAPHRQGVSVLVFVHELGRAHRLVG